MDLLEKRKPQAAGNPSSTFDAFLKQLRGPIELGCGPVGVAMPEMPDCLEPQQGADKRLDEIFMDLFFQDMPCPLACLKSGLEEMP